jgi:galactokinase
VNLIGEHTDYNEGFVLPVAIELSTRVAFASVAGASVVVRSSAFPADEVEIPVGVRGAKRGHWSDYVCGVLRALEARSVSVPPAGLLIDSDLPLGSGLSSSASLEVATAGALLEIAARELPKEEVALLCHRAENEFVGARCGIMDPFISALGRAGEAMLLDCRSRETTFVPLPDSVEIVIVSSGVRHSLASGEYNRRRVECESAVSALARTYPEIAALRDVSVPLLERAQSRLGGVEYRRARHVVTENARVLDFVAALRCVDLDRLGSLMAESHLSLRDDYEVSCAELDLLVGLAERQPGVVGARMTGGGFGGCTVNLVRAGVGGDFAGAVADGYEAETGHRPEVWRTRSAEGAGVD